MELRKRLVKREIGGESYLIPVGTTIYDTNGLFYLTEVGGFIWDLLPRARDGQQILAAVLAEYDVDEATARADMEDFLEKLRKFGVI